MDHREFIHPEGEAAMRNLEGVPGFVSVAKFRMFCANCGAKVNSERMRQWTIVSLCACC